MLRQGKANFVFTSPLSIDHPATEHVRRHGDGVHDIAFEVEDVDSAFEYAVTAEPCRQCSRSRSKMQMAASGGLRYIHTATLFTRSFPGTIMLALLCLVTNPYTCPAMIPASCVSTTSSVM